MSGQYDFSTKQEIIQSFVIKPDGTIVSDGRKIKVAAKGDPGKTPQKEVDYFDGKDGIGRPPTCQWEGTGIRFQNPDGSWPSYVDLKGKKGDPGDTPKKGVDYNDGSDGVTPVKGKDYNDGSDGITPVKGKDYKDGEDGKPGVEPEEMANIRSWLASMKRDIDKMTLTLECMAERISNVKDGEDGYTPVKGKDYDDGKDGVTPKKGVDYKDGEPAKLPESVTMTVITAVDFDKKSFKQQDVKFYL
jgi:hypothetical protein